MATLTSTMIVRLLDKVSGPAKSVASSITGIGRAADAAGSTMAGRIQGAIERNNAALDRTRGQLIDAVGGYYLLKNALTSVIAPAVAFESAMADVAKVSGFDDKGIDLYGKQLRKLATTEIPLAVEELAALSAAAAQAGVADAELLDFTRMTAKAAVAWEMTGAAAGESLAKIKAQLNLTTAETEVFASAINHLSDNSAASAADLVDYARRVSAAGEFFGYTKEQTLAFGSAMVGTGAQAEVAATSFQNMGRALTRGASATKRQREAFATLGMDAKKVAEQMQVDAVGTTIKVIEAIGKLPAEIQAATLSDLFGDEARALAPLLNNIEILKNTLALVSDETKYASSVQDEFARRSKTTANAWQLFKNRMNDVSLAVGGSLLPALNGIMGSLEPLLLKLAEFADANPRLTQAVVAATAGLIGLRIAMIGVRFAALMARGGLLSMLLPIARIGGAAHRAATGAVALQTSLAALSGVRYTRMQKVGTAIGGIARAVPGIGLLGGMASGVAATAAALTAPAWGAIAIGVAAVGAGGALVYRYWDRLTSIVSGVARAFGEQFAPAIDAVKPYIEWLKPVGEVIAAGWDKAKSAIGGFMDWIGSFFEREILTDEGKANFERAGYDAMNALLDGLKSAAGAVLDYVRGLASQIADAISGAISNAVGSLGRWVGIGGADAPEAAAVEERAKGGSVRSGQTYLVGEKGPELWQAPGNGRIIPNDRTMAMLRGSVQSAREGGASGSTTAQARQGQHGHEGQGMSAPTREAGARGGDRTISIVNNVTIKGVVSDAREAATEVADEIERRLRVMLRGIHADVQL